MLKKFWVLLAGAMLLTSCFDVTDKIAVNKDGSGSYDRVINYNSFLSMMSSMGGGDSARQETWHSIDSGMQAQLRKLKSSGSISNATMSMSADSTVYTLHFDFSNLAAVNSFFYNESTDETTGEKNKQTEFFRMKKGKIEFAGGLPGMFDPAEAENSGEEMEMMASFFSSNQYELQVTVPGKLKKSSNKAFSKTTKTVANYSGTIESIIKNMKSNAVTLSYK